MDLYLQLPQSPPQGSPWIQPGSLREALGVPPGTEQGPSEGCLRWLCIFDPGSESLFPGSFSAQGSCLIPFTSLGVCMAYWEASGKAQGRSPSWPPGPSTPPSSTPRAVPRRLQRGPVSPSFCWLFCSCSCLASCREAPVPGSEWEEGRGQVCGRDRGAGTGFSQGLPSQACLWAVPGPP